MNADGSQQRNLTNISGSDVTPVWSPDGKHISFQSLRDGNYEIYIMNADGTQQANLTNKSGDDILNTYSWSPDGMHIAFESNRDGDDEIYIMNIDGSQQKRLTNSKEPDQFPIWSPDGTHILFTKQLPEESDGTGRLWYRSELYILGVDGSGLANLTSNGGYNEGPNWKR
jgi:Tol biopolymer transport system component